MSRLPSGRPLPDTPTVATALTHSTWAHEHGGPDNERLEFLGDAVLQLCASQRLFAEHPLASERALTELRKGAVNNARLADLARQLDLGPALRLGHGEDEDGGRDKGKVLAGALEALFGALYLDEGLDAVQVEVDAALAAQAASGRPYASARNQLQEWWQQRFKCVPPFGEPVGSGPDHQRVFTVALAAPELGLDVVGEGRSKGEAHEQASARALAALGVRRGAADPPA